MSAGQPEFSGQARKDARMIKAWEPNAQVEARCSGLAADPVRNPRAFRNPAGDLATVSARRIYLQRRLVREELRQERGVRVLWRRTHDSR